MSVSSQDYTLREVEQFIDLVHWLAKSSTGDYSEKPDWWDERDGDWGCPITRDEFLVERCQNAVMAARAIVKTRIFDYDDRYYVAEYV